MKRFLLVILCLVFLLPGVARAFDDVCQYTTSIASSALVATGAVKLHGLFFTTDGTNAQTIVIYDNTTGSDPKAISTFIVPTSATDRWRWVWFNTPILLRTGLYISITGSGTAGVQAYIAR